MSIQQDSILNELKLRIKLLEHQSEQRAEQMEDKLLLWLIADTVSQADNVDDLLYHLLERICMVRELPYAACCQISGTGISLLNQFTPHIEKFDNGLSFNLSPELLEQLKSGPCFLDGNKMVDEGFNLSSTFFFSPESIAIFPFHSLSVPFGVYVFFYDEKTEQDISGFSIIIRQIINLASEKLDKLTVLDELKELNASFEDKLRVRTHDLVEKNNRLENEVRTLKQKLSSAGKHQVYEPVKNDPGSSLLHNLGHEIRTPLNGILGFADILRKDDLNATDREKYINIIKLCGKSVLRIVEDIIDLTDIETKQIKVVNEEFQLGKFMTELYDTFKNDELFRQKEEVDLNLSMDLDGHSMVHADQQKIRQILSHLVGNALKFTAKGFVEVGCKIQYADPPKKGLQDLLFIVRDSGIGIEKGIQDLVFDRFFKVEHEISRLVGGTGLGLTIAHDLAEMLNGKIWFTSEPGVGTQFYFLLPAAVEEVSKEKALTGKELKNKYNWQGKKILIVEDDEMSYVYLKEILKSTRVDIVHAKNGREAIELVESTPDINLVLMDIKLPEMDGYEATTRIKQMRPTIPVIAQTAYAMADDHQKILQAGCDDYITKPINRRKLMQTVEALIVKS